LQDSLPRGSTAIRSRAGLFPDRRALRNMCSSMAPAGTLFGDMGRIRARTYRLRAVLCQMLGSLGPQVGISPDCHHSTHMVTSLTPTHVVVRRLVLTPAC